MSVSPFKPLPPLTAPIHSIKVSINNTTGSMYEISSIHRTGFEFNFLHYPEAGQNDYSLVTNRPMW